FRHTLAVTHDNSIAEYLLGQTLQTTKPDDAMPHLRRAIALVQPLLQLPDATPPDWYAQAYVGIGTATLTKARAMPESPARDALVRQAIDDFGQALAIDPNAAHARNNVGVAMQMLPAESPAALQLRYDLFLNNGTAFSQQGQYDQAIEQFKQATGIFPRSVEAHIYLGLGLLQANKKGEGITELRIAKSLDAAQANTFLTKALRLPPNDGNFDGFLEQASK
ncbi:MAG: tetratricopeptide repeat protein, partial [Thermoanaerobaculia bacterium]